LILFKHKRRFLNLYRFGRRVSSDLCSFGEVFERTVGRGFGRQVRSMIFLRWILFLASMGIAKHDLYFNASVFLVSPTEISRYSAWNTHLKFYYFGINLFAHYLRLSKLPIQIVWYYDVVEWSRGGMGSGLSPPSLCHLHLGADGHIIRVVKRRHRGWLSRWTNQDFKVGILMRNRRNTSTQSRVKTARQAGTRSARVFFIFFKNENANKETKRQFCVLSFLPAVHHN